MTATNGWAGDGRYDRQPDRGTSEGILLTIETQLYYHWSGNHQAMNDLNGEHVREKKVFHLSHSVIVADVEHARRSTGFLCHQLGSLGIQ